MYSYISRAAKLTSLLLLNLNCLIFFIIIGTCNNVQCHRNPSTQTVRPHQRARSASYIVSKDLRLGHSLLLAAGQPIATTTSAPVVLQTTQEAPDFTEPIGNHTVALGRDAQLSCKIKSLGNFRTAWLRVEDKGILTIHNNIITRNYRIGLTNNDDGKNFVLTIKNVQPSDRGGYMCQINSVPMKYAIGYLDVLTPPAFDDQPTVTTTATMAGQEPSGSQAQQATSSSSAASPTSVVTIAEGGNVTLSCKATGHPNPVISWRREDNEPILPNGASSLDGGVIKSEGPSITMSSVSRLSSGAYLCIASNNVQPSASRRQVLDVQFSPVVRLPQTEVGAQIGQQSARLSCHVELNPLGSYHWVKLNGDSSQTGVTSNRQQLQTNELVDDLTLIEHDELNNSDKFEIVIQQVNNDKVQMTLTIRQIEKKDFAWYKCIGRNSLGTQSNSIKLYESSSFSLNNMFRGSSSDGASQLGEANTEQLRQQQHLNDQDTGSGSGRAPPAKPVLSRTHTRSSWVQRSSQAGRGQDQASFESPAGSSAAAASPTTHRNLLAFSSSCHYVALSLLLLSLDCYLIIASQLAQIVVSVTP